MYYHHQTGVSRTNGWRLLALLLLGLTMMQAVGMLSMSTRVEPADLVYQVCNESRTSPTISEHGCAALQDQLGYEYLCNQRNTDPANRCWVEEK